MDGPEEVDIVSIFADIVRRVGKRCTTNQDRS